MVVLNVRSSLKDLNAPYKVDKVAVNVRELEMPVNKY